MYEAKLEFPEGWGGGGVIGQIPSMVGVWIYSEPHIIIIVCTRQERHKDPLQYITSIGINSNNPAGTSSLMHFDS